LSAGDLVNLWNDSGTVKARKANATATGKRADGYVLAAVSGAATATVYVGRGSVITGLSGLTVGEAWLATTGGAIASSAPSASGNVVQRVGVALSASSLLFDPLADYELT
jgi:hypothetical protein